jgi:hypothetical protein
VERGKKADALDVAAAAASSCYGMGCLQCCDFRSFLTVRSIFESLD